MAAMNRTWLENRLKSVGLTQQALAISAGMREPAISEILSDTRQLKLEEACKIASLLKCSMDEFYFAYKGKRIESGSINRVLLSKAIKDSLEALSSKDSSDEEKALIITLRYDDLIKEAMYEQVKAV